MTILQRFASSNFGQFLATRKFWVGPITTIQTLLVWWLPTALHIEVTQDMQAVMTVVLWGLAGIVATGDVRYDWITQQNAAQG